MFKKTCTESGNDCYFIQGFGSGTLNCDSGNIDLPVYKIFH